VWGTGATITSSRCCWPTTAGFLNAAPAPPTPSSPEIQPPPAKKTRRSRNKVELLGYTAIGYSARYHATDHANNNFHPTSLYADIAVGGGISLASPGRAYATHAAGVAATPCGVISSLHCNDSASNTGRTASARAICAATSPRAFKADSNVPSVPDATFVFIRGWMQMAFYYHMIYSPKTNNQGKT
jgi:hypothetical protein